MKWRDLAEESCSVARSVAVIGDRWTLMILRDCFLGVRRFEDFERRLGISRSIIADRLKTLVDEGVLRKQAYQERPFQTLGLYTGLYILITALSLPGAAVMTLAGGAIFGLWVGAPVAVISASIGATLAFWMARYVFRDVVQRHFGNRLAAIDAGIKRDGAFYLFTLRLIPIFPFFVINVLMGLTAIRTATLSIGRS